jgi:NAD(P)-dependent dehydrogenase (short-subunit alcohol dehydrogenase family)
MCNQLRQEAIIRFREKMTTNTSSIQSLSTQTALVSSPNSGLGFEAAALRPKARYDRVILACRTLDKASDARTRLLERTGMNIFDVLAIDVAES